MVQAHRPIKRKRCSQSFARTRRRRRKRSPARSWPFTDRAQAVPDLAKLLPDPQLSSWARIALEAIPGEAADEALRTASDSLEGKLLVGTINSIGVRRDAGAVDSLTARLQDKDAEVASAAAVALGRIGNDAATKSLREALAAAPANVRQRSCRRLRAVCRTIARRRQVRQPRRDLRRSPQARMFRSNESSKRLAARFSLATKTASRCCWRHFDRRTKSCFSSRLGTAREFPGGEIDKALATEMVGATPERAALMIQAMADRPETVVLAAVLKAAEQGDKQVRISAIDALRRVGDDSCLAALLEIAVESDADLAQAAKTHWLNFRVRTSMRKSSRFCRQPKETRTRC